MSRYIPPWRVRTHSFGDDCVPPHEPLHEPASVRPDSDSSEQAPVPKAPATSAEGDA